MDLNFTDFFKKIKKNFLKYDVYWLMLLALALRVFGRGSSSYGVSGELYRDMEVIFNFIRFGQWPLLGPSSSLGGFNFGAIYYYILTPFVWIFNFAPYGATAASLVSSVLSIWMFYKLLRLWFNQINIARLGAFLLAISVLDIQYSYYVSNPNFLPFFLLWFFYCLTYIISGKDSWKYYVGLGLAFGAATQLHATALLSLPLITAAAFIAGKKSILSVKWLVAAALAAILYLPYIIYEFRNFFINSRTIFYLSQNNYAFAIRVSSIASIVMFFQSFMVARAGLFDFFELHFLAATLLFAIFLFLLFWIVLRRKKYGIESFGKAISANGKVIFMAWLAIGLLMFLFFQRPIQPFYFLVLWPLPLIIFAWFINETAQKQKLLGFSLIAAFCLAQSVQLWYFYPKVYITRMDHKNLLQDFSIIRSRARGQTFIAINQFADVNQFHYYEKLTGIDEIITRNSAEKVFIMCDPDYIEACRMGRTIYHKVSDFWENGLFVIEYDKT